jgi:hypothetical protein
MLRNSRILHQTWAIDIAGLSWCLIQVQICSVFLPPTNCQMLVAEEAKQRPAVPDAGVDTGESYTEAGFRRQTLPSRPQRRSIFFGPKSRSILQTGPETAVSGL